MAWSVDRLGRSLQDLVGFLSELHALKIDLFLRQQGLDTTTPASKALFQMMGVFAEFERANGSVPGLCGPGLRGNAPDHSLKPKSARKVRADGSTAR
jgi:Resolvase, N terminal domain